MFQNILSKILGLIPLPTAIAWVMKFLFDYSKKTDNTVDDAGVAFLYMTLHQAGVCGDVKEIDEYLKTPSKSPIKSIGNWTIDKLWDVAKKSSNKLDDSAVLIVYLFFLEWGVCDKNETIEADKRQTVELP
jgi:hypothetical protein